MPLAQSRDLAITRLGAGELRDRIASGELSAAEVVEAHIRRIEAVNPRLNAVVVPLFDQARTQAQAADAARQRGEPLGPLHGVPVTIKEMFDVAGTPTTLGLTTRAAVKAAADAAPVARLRQAGAIVLGKTNVPQFGMMYESDNPVYGRTNNPWDLGRAPGGSSGGEAAIVAAGGSPLGLGSDGGGSIRHPCHSCGVHGFKPTTGRLTFRGHPISANYPVEYAQPGPIARHVADLDLLLRVLAAPGQEVIDPTVAPAAWPDPSAVRIDGLRVGWYTYDGLYQVAPGLRRAVHEAAAALRAMGAQVAEFEPPEVGEAWRIYLGRLWADGGDTVRELARGGPQDWRMRRILLGLGLPTLFRRPLPWLCERLGRPFEARLYRALPRRRLAVTEYLRLMADQAAYRVRFLAALDAARLDVLLSPPHGLPALTHGAEYGAVGGCYTLLYNLLGMPAGVVAAIRVRPGEESDRDARKDRLEAFSAAVEKGSAGLPVGVQVAARPWRDDVALAVMAALEAHFRKQPDYPGWPPLE
jgi:fatty acid amide hydrolase